MRASTGHGAIRIGGESVSQRKSELVLISIAMAWGLSWLFMKMGLEGLSPLDIVFLRFSVAFVAIAVVFHRKLRDITLTTALCAAASGTVLFGVCASVLYGLGTTMASTGGFIISVQVVFVAVIQAVLVKKLPRLGIVIAAGLCVAGVCLLTDANPLDFDAGSLWILLAALLNAVYIVFVGAVSDRVDAFQLGALQLGVAALLAGAGAVCFDVIVLPDSLRQWIAVLGLGLLCSAYCFVMQPVAQRNSTPERAGIFWSSEALFSAVFAFALLGERLAPLNCLGAVLVMSGVAIALTDWDRVRARLRGRTLARAPECEGGPGDV